MACKRCFLVLLGLVCLIGAVCAPLTDAAEGTDRLQIDQGDPSRLHLAGNVADVLIAAANAGGSSEREALRVLRPGGRALLGDRELVKPVPDGMDDWSHPYHGPDNNPVSQDRLIRAPYLTQLLADPRYGPAPQTAVAAAGRVFKAFGHVRVDQPVTTL